MAEPLSWLKLGQRSRTPTIPSQANPLESKANSDSQPGDVRRPSSSPTPHHVPSPGVGLEPPFTGDDPTNRLVRNQDQVWYNPVRYVWSHAHGEGENRVSGTAQ